MGKKTQRWDDFFKAQEPNYTVLKSNRENPNEVSVSILFLKKQQNNGIFSITHLQKSMGSKKTQAAYFASEKILEMDGPIEIETLNLCVDKGRKSQIRNVRIVYDAYTVKLQN